MNVRRRLVVGLTLGGVLFAGARARADDALDACSAAAVEGQKLERAGKLLDARARYETCARSDCRADIVQDCNGWLGQVVRRTPSVVVDVRDEQGRPIRDAVVSIDGNPVSAAVIASPVSLDPGTHTVTFERGARLSRTVILREGERADVSVMFAPPPSRSPPPARPAPGETRAIPTPVLVAGGVALAAFATFGVAAGIGYADWSDTTCNVRCGPDDASRVESKLLVADVALATGVVATLVAGAFYLFR